MPCPGSAIPMLGCCDQPTNDAQALLYRQVIATVTARTAGAPKALGWANTVLSRAKALCDEYALPEVWSSNRFVEMVLNADGTEASRVESLDEAPNLRTDTFGPSHGINLDTTTSGGSDGRGRPSMTHETIIGARATCWRGAYRGQRFIATAYYTVEGGAYVVRECSARQSPPLYADAGFVYDIFLAPQSPLFPALPFLGARPGNYDAGVSYAIRWRASGLPLISGC